jgi:osmotically-inducible protein OsmY
MRPGAVLACCAVIAALNPPRRSPDEHLRRLVVERLGLDPVTQHRMLRVAASSGVVTIAGEIADRREEAQALAIIAHTDGVLDVIDDMTISDEVIVRRVRDALHTDPMVSAVPVTVTSAGGAVTLRSHETNADQRRRMVQIASLVDGVSQVVDEMK